MNVCAVVPLGSHSVNGGATAERVSEAHARVALPVRTCAEVPSSSCASSKGGDGEAESASSKGGEEERAASASSEGGDGEAESASSEGGEEERAASASSEGGDG